MSAIIDHGLRGWQAIKAGNADYSHNDMATNLTDALANMMHAATLLRLDFHACLAMAEAHWRAEWSEDASDGRTWDGEPIFYTEAGR